MKASELNPTRFRRLGRRRERGHLLVWVAVFGILSMGYWAIAFRATGDCIRAERAMLLRQTRDQGVARALAAAVALLRTGTPAESPYECVVTTDDGSKSTATYTRTLNDGEWTVEVHPATAEDISGLPAAPTTF